MGLFDSIKRNLNIGGPKVRFDIEAARTDMDGEALATPITLIGGGDDAHVSAVRLELWTNPVKAPVSPNTNGMPRRDELPYQLLRYTFDNGGAGWELAPGQELSLALTMDLQHDDAGQEVDLYRRLTKNAPNMSIMFTQGRTPSLNLRVVADVERVAVDPSDQISVQLDYHRSYGL